MSSIDRFRDRKAQIEAGTGFDTEDLISTLYRKQGLEEIRILVATKGGHSLVLIRTMKREGDIWMTSRWISIVPDQIEAVLDGLDKAGIHYLSVAGAPEDTLPTFPISCGDAGDLTVKLDRYNGYFNIKITRRTGNDWAIIRPNEIEEVIAALLNAYDRITGSHTEGPIEEEVPF